jgi:GH43 family beta-xylosidase
MAWGQVAEKAQCKECGADFTSKMVFGQMTSRCNDCRDAKGFKFVAKPAYNPMNAPHWRKAAAPCPNNSDGNHQYNPGGYCACGAGGDWS